MKFEDCHSVDLLDGSDLAKACIELIMEKREVTDIVLSIICFICTVFGVPANMYSLYFFLKKTRDLPTCMYIVISATDILTCVIVLPVGICLAAHRQPMMFNSKVFCSVWGLTWELIPYYSVFLVFMLSFMRTIVLVRPLTRIKKSVIITVLVVYGSFLVFRQLLGVILGHSHYKFQASSGYCWNHIDDSKYQVSDAFFSTVQLAFPIIPITISCMLSLYTMRSSITITQQQGSITRMKKEATKTIILITMVYIVFNLPVFLNYSRYIITVYVIGKDFLDPNNANWFVQEYIWLFTYIITVALNSISNPIVYFLRMKNFRRHLKKKFGPRTYEQTLANSHSHTELYNVVNNKTVCTDL